MNNQADDCKPTPRTDAEAGWVLDGTPVHAQGFERDPDGSYVGADFARSLERELNEAKARISELEFAGQDLYCLALAWSGHYGFTNCGGKEHPMHHAMIERWKALVGK